VIRIDKPVQGPANLDEGKALVEDLKMQRLRDPGNGTSKQRAFKFSNTVYGAAAVKAALRRAQHHKCCYCEGYFAGQAPGDVEHFRPKTCVQQARGGEVTYPGYFWLAYSWRNLFYSCEICNRSGKKNLFPLADPAQRLTGPDDPPDQEQPLLLDPGGEADPRDHIRFEGPTPVGITPIGRSTINVLRLDRGDLKVTRVAHLKVLRAWSDLASLDPAQLDVAVRDKRERAIVELRNAVEPDAIYSSMAIDYLAAPEE
jgi:hypothetical protein